MTLRGTMNSTNVDLLRPALSQLAITAPIPGLELQQDKLIAGVFGHLGFPLPATGCPSNPKLADLPVTLLANNRFSAPMSITGTCNLCGAFWVVVVPVPSLLTEQAHLQPST